jgi:hypothetical protein
MVALFLNFLQMVDFRNTMIGAEHSPKAERYSIAICTGVMRLLMAWSSIPNERM